jgi:hypothetical protein
MVVNTTLCDAHCSGAKQIMQPFIIPREILASRISLVSTGNPALNQRKIQHIAKTEELRCFQITIHVCWTLIMAQLSSRHMVMLNHATQEALGLYEHFLLDSHFKHNVIMNNACF